MTGEDIQSNEIGAILIERRLVTSKQFREAQSEQSRTGRKLSQILVSSGSVTEEDFLSAAAEVTGQEYWRFRRGDIDREALRIVPKRFAETHQVLPVQLDAEKGRLIVAMTDPDDLAVLDLLRRFTQPSNLSLSPLMASPASIHRGLSYAYQSAEAITSVEKDVSSQAGARADLAGSNDLPEIKRILNEILYEAAVEGASDIHLENLEARIRVRFRIDGILQERHTGITKQNIGQVISILKIDSGLDITERRRPQDGVFRKRIGDDWFIDFRAHVHCSQFGGDAVIRILDTTRKLPRLDQLGLSQELLESYQRMIQKPQGLILITGPTGSGKSTTLYSTLSSLNTPERKIVTAEDPVEYHLDGICQYQVNDLLGNTFSEYARRFLRKDPDIILIGETRDETTAAACLRAAMTGHLVFTTLHTNHTTASISRLRDLGVDSSSISDALLGVLAQRLVRMNCRNCLSDYLPDDSILDELVGAMRPKNPGTRFVKGTGCPSCEYTGYRGRIGVFEMWELDEATRRGILAGQDEWSLSRMTLKQGTRPLFDDALDKVGQGLTTLEEVHRVVPGGVPRSRSESPG